MKVIVYSVPGTGSRFCNTFIEEILGYKVSYRRAFLTDSDRCYMLMHSLDANRNLEKPIPSTEERPIDEFMSKQPTIKLVSPLRDPYLSYITRLEMGGMDDAEGKQTMINYWRVFIRKTAIYRPIFVPVHCAPENRLKLLQTTAQHIGAQVPKLQLHNYVKEWHKVGTTGDSELKTEYLTHGTIEGEKPHFLDFAFNWVDSKHKIPRS